jgi:prolyl oligopeptidase
VIQKTSIVLLCLLALSACGGKPTDEQAAASGAARLTYPESKRGEQVDEYHGEKVADPYRWLEDVDSAATKAWVEAQNKVTFGYLEQIPQRAAIKERLTQLWNFERFGVPVKRGNKYFYTRNDGLQNQAVLHVADSLDSAPRVLLDPNTLLADGTAALVGWEPSEDGKLLAYGIAEAGSDWEIWRVRDVATGKDSGDELKWVKWASATFDKGAKGIYYSRYDEPKANETLRAVNYFNKVYYHKLGDAQSKDKLVYEKPDKKDWIFSSTVTEDGRYLILNNWSGGVYGTNQIMYRDLSKPNAPMVELLMGFDSSYVFVGTRAAASGSRRRAARRTVASSRSTSPSRIARSGRRSFPRRVTCWRASAWSATASLPCI